MFALLRRLRARFKYRDFERDLARELEVHRAMKQDELQASGVDSRDARSGAIRSLGNVTYMREESRSVWIARWLEQGWQDVRYASRQLRRFPAYSIGATLVLAIGVATATVVFSAVNATLLRPWLVDEADELILVRALPSFDGQVTPISAAEAQYLKAHSRTIREFATYMRGGAVASDPPIDVQSNRVSGSYLSALRINVSRGRLLTDDDGRPGAVPVGLISHRLWETAFDRDPNIVGRTVHLRSGPLTIVGVVEPGFVDVHRLRTDLWVPQDNQADPTRPVNIVARLADGVDASKAAIELQALSGQYRQANNLPVSELNVRNTRPINDPGARGDIRLFLRLIPALGLLMLLVCTNVGGLVLARTSARLRELAVRRALGASRARVNRQVFTEVLMLACGAGLLGVAGARILPFFLGNRMRVEQFEPDLSVVVVAFLLSGLAALLAASSALLRARRISVGMLVAHRHGTDRSGGNARSILIATQLAISTAVLTGAGLMTRAIVHAADADPGFSAEGIQTFRFVGETRLVRIPAGGGDPLAREIELARRWRSEIESMGIPGIAFASHPPVSRSFSVVGIRKPGDHVSTRRQVSQRPVSSSYFELLGIRILEGRSRSDLAGSSELVVSEKAARWLWPSESALGQLLVVKEGRGDRTYTVVGVAADVATRELGETEATIYTGCDVDICGLALASSAEPGLASQIVEAAKRVEGSARVDQRTVRQIMETEGTSDLRDASQAAWVIGLSALALSLVGAVGVLAYTVEERRREIGIRMALGGRAWPVAMAVMAAANRPAMWGMGIGTVAAAVLATLLRHEVFGLSPFDPFAYALVVLVVVPPIALAAVIPARRATRVDPAITLRHD